jgi:MurNAc alpha-1-phosphate uridylyltransferase
MSITTAMILAAGRGERLRPLTDSTPKPLIDIAGKPLIEYHIENLARAGIKKIVINTSWLGEQIHRALGDGSAYGVSIQYSDEPEALETAGGIIQALPLLGESFIVVNGDIWSDFDFSAWLDKPIKTQAHLLLVDNPEHNPAGDFAMANTMLVNHGAPMYTFSGIGRYTSEFFTGITQGRAALAPILRQKCDKHLISAEYYPGAWLDIGSMQRLQQLRARLAENAGNSANKDN